MDYHDVFSLEEGERGETDMVELNTGDELSRKQAARRIPYAACQEVAEQLQKSIQKTGVIKPSSSLWFSPVVLVRKRDRTLRFCVNYRVLNSVTINQMCFRCLELTFYWISLKSRSSTLL